MYKTAEERNRRRRKSYVYYCERLLFFITNMQYSKESDFIRKNLPER